MEGPLKYFFGPIDTNIKPHAPKLYFFFLLFLFFFFFWVIWIGDIAIEMWKINAVILKQKERKKVSPTALENDGKYKFYV